MSKDLSPAARVTRIRMHLDRLKPHASPLNRAIIKEIEDMVKHLEQSWLKEDA